MKVWLCIIALVVLVLCASPARSQSSTDCPSGLVCISPDAARKALLDSDTVKAQSVEIAAKDKAIQDYKDEIDKMRIELAKAIGEKTGSEQMVIRLTAIIDFMLKNGRTKKYGLFNL